MALAVANRDGGKTSERGFADAVRSLVAGSIISGFRVRENSPLGMSIRIGGEYNATTGVGRDSALIDDGVRAYEVFTDDGAAVTVPVDAAHASLPRLDSVVVYVDKSVARSTSVLDNINGVIKAKVVAGTPASTPAAPSASAIQTSIGAGNPYVVLGRVSVPAAVTQITSDKVTDLRTMASAVLADGAVSTAKLADGAVTSQKTKTTVAFFAYLGVSQITSNSTFKVALGAELYDQGSNYDTTQYRFVAPVAGVYHFDMTASAGNASTMRLTPTIYKNGAQLMIGPTLDVPYVSCELHTDLKLNANDYIEFYLACNNVAGLNFGTAPLSTYMSGHLVGTTS